MQQSFFNKFIIFFLLLVGLGACNLTKEIEVDLPEYESEYVVESYMKVGEPFNLLLTTTSGYFDQINLDSTAELTGIFSGLINNATVKISANGVDYELLPPPDNFPFPFFFDDSGAIFNYQSEELVPELYDTDFMLTITDSVGNEIKAISQLIRPLPIDSFSLRYNDDTLALMLTHLTDDPTTDNYYRRQLHFGSLDSLEFEFQTDDRLTGENDQLVFGSGFDYAVGDTVISTIYHLSKDYYDFLEISSIAAQSNGNPFAQPTSVFTNIEGGIGIFTSISFDRKTVIIPPLNE